MLNWGPAHPLELISARIDGEITPGEVRHVEAHLRSCPSCEQKQAELKAIVAELAGVASAAPPAGMVDRLLVRLALRNDHETVAAQAAPADPVHGGAQTVAEPPASRWRSGTSVPHFDSGVSETVTPKQPTTSAEEHHTLRTTMFPWPALASTGAAVAVVAVLYTAVVGARADRAGGAVLSRPSAAPARSAPRELPQATAAIAGDAAPPPRRSTASWKEAPVAAKPPRVTAPPERAPVEPPPEAAQPAGDEPRGEAGADTDAALAPISFHGNSKRLTHETKQRLAAVAELLRQNPDADLLIRSYADGGDSIEKNRELGERRARVVARQIEKLGIDAGRLKRATLTEPPAAAAADDRVEFVLTR